MSYMFVYVGIILFHDINRLVAAAQRLQGTRTRMRQGPGFPALRGPKWAARRFINSSFQQFLALAGSNWHRFQMTDTLKYLME